MHGLKSAILAISQKLPDWLDWLCPISAALHFCPELKLTSEVTPGLLVIQIQIQAAFRDSKSEQVKELPTKFREISQFRVGKTMNHEQLTNRILKMFFSNLILKTAFSFSFRSW